MTPRHRAAAWLPGLDGLRALSILLVLAAHAAATRGAPHPRWADAVPLTRTTGVCLFFLLSGYLITHLLLDEKRRFGTISPGRFYARRALRILPASYALLVVCVVARQIGWLHFSDRGLWASATYWRNYFRGAEPGDWVLDHTWSLSVEEQFYLAWPLVVWRFRSSVAAVVALAGALGWPLLRLIRHGALVQASGRAALDVAGMDTILAGCLLALAIEAPRWRGAVARPASLPGAPWLALGSIWGLYAAADSLPPSLSVVLPLARNGLMLWLLAITVRRSVTAAETATGEAESRGLFDRILDTRVAVTLGRASYSLYLWQQLFLQPDHSAWICAFPQNLVAALLAAAISFVAIEKPCNRLRARLAPVERRAPDSVDSVKVTAQAVY